MGTKLHTFIDVFDEETGSYDKKRGKFRTYLSHLLYNEMIDHYRRAQARREDLHIPIEEGDIEVDVVALDQYVKDEYLE